MSTPFTPEKAQVLLGSELSSIKAEWPVTRSVIAAIPPDKSDYTPDPVTRSAIELAWHIVMAENRFLGAVADGAFDGRLAVPARDVGYREGEFGGHGVGSSPMGPVTTGVLMLGREPWNPR